MPPLNNFKMYLKLLYRLKCVRAMILVHLYQDKDKKCVCTLQIGYEDNLKQLHKSRKFSFFADYYLRNYKTKIEHKGKK